MAKRQASSSKGKLDSVDEGTHTPKKRAVPAEKAMNIVVTLADHAIADAKKIGAKLKKSGMTIESHLDIVGQYIGTSTIADVARLAAVEGVAAVEKLGEVQLPPSPLDPQ